MLSKFDFSQGFNDAVETNVWRNRMGVTIEDGQLTATNLGVLGSCDISGIRSFTIVMTPAASDNPTMSGVLLVGNRCTLRAVWVPTQNEFVLSYCSPKEDDPSDLPDTLDGDEEQDDQSNEVQVKVALTAGTQYEITVTLENEEATLRIDGEGRGSVPCSAEYKNVQVFASSQTKLRSVNFQ